MGFHLFHLKSTPKFHGCTPVPGCLSFLVSRTFLRANFSPLASVDACECCEDERKTR
ncbi:hypothetical protein B0H19DRAFT_1089173 [Mycena capillaripes]|nr:hypothetical protein B0H19DRAFT_1089173 [Mycena capillaripes]